MIGILKLAKRHCYIQMTLWLHRIVTVTACIYINTLASGRFQSNFRLVIFKQTLVNGGWGISYEIALRWMPLDLIDDKSTLVQVMAWCGQATSHYLSQCWPRSMSPNGVIRPQWVKRWMCGKLTLNVGLHGKKIMSWLENFCEINIHSFVFSEAQCGRHREDRGGIHICSPLREQDEVWSEDVGSALWSAGNVPDGEQQEVGRSGEGAVWVQTSDSAGKKHSIGSWGRPYFYIETAPWDM